MNEKNQRKLNLIRFGLTLIPFVAWAMVFTRLYLISSTARLDWVQIALVPSIGEAVVVVVHGAVDVLVETGVRRCRRGCRGRGGAAPRAAWRCVGAATLVVDRAGGGPLAARRRRVHGRRARGPLSAGPCTFLEDEWRATATFARRSCFFPHSLSWRAAKAVLRSAAPSIATTA